MKIYLIFLVNLMFFCVSSLHGMDVPEGDPRYRVEKSKIQHELECLEKLDVCIAQLEDIGVVGVIRKKPGQCYPRLEKCLSLLASGGVQPSEEGKDIGGQKKQVRTIINPKDQLSSYFDQHTLDLMEGKEVYDIVQWISHINLAFSDYQTHHIRALECVKIVNELLNKTINKVTTIYSRKNTTPNIHAYFVLIKRVIEAYSHLIHNEFNIMNDDIGAWKREMSRYACSLDQVDRTGDSFCNSIPHILATPCAADNLQLFSWKLAQMIDLKNGNDGEKLSLLYYIQQTSQVFCGSGKQVTFFLQSLMPLVLQALEVD